ncbi:hypothetical protein SAMN04488522_1021109 [Pedobacter caeni]|uniref:Lipoprotein n=2 Tax=Pedobacter caeni TaxID=288992 RepID=A0A1M5BB07_9SPHI|nr:hypothetical protein SAMN04488522_1021109 [Pedobacter caeni]
MRLNILIGMAIAIISCNSTETKEHDLKKDSMLTNVLIRQLKDGPSSDYNPTEYGETDFEVTIPILKNKLEENGFKYINKATFVEKIKLYFNRTIDTNNVDKYLYVDYLKPCNRKLHYHPNDYIELEGTLVLKNQFFITDSYSIPEIIDYQSKFAELSYLEDKPRFIYDGVEKEKVEIDRWKDVKDLQKLREKNIQVLVHRNKYLFNDDKASLTWLTFNDNTFLTRLLVLFGYDQEPKVNKMVLDSVYKENIDKGETYNQCIANLFFIKDCNGKLQIRNGLLKYVEDNTSSTDNRFLYALGDYVSTLYNGDINELFNEDPSKKFTSLEKAKIVAYIANIENPAIEKYKKDQVIWGKTASTLYNLSVSHPEVIKLIQQNNYFELSRMKTIIEKLQEEGPVE